MKNLTKNFGILLIGIMLGFAINIFVFQQDIILKNDEINRITNPVFVSLMIDFGDGKIISCNNQKLQEKQTVFDLLELCSKDSKKPFDLKYKNYPDLGVFIEQIGDKKSGLDKYWQYWINNEYSQVGASQYQLKDKDIIEWKFIKGQL